MKKHITKPKLKRELGLIEVTLCGIGIIFGAGIYALVGKAAGMAGNFVWLSFVLAAVIAGLTGLSYAELSSLFPKAGAEYEYIKKAFEKRIAFLIGWLIIAGGAIAGAAVALGFAGYFSVLFNTPIIAVAIALIVILSLIVIFGIKQSTWIAIIFTLIESAGLILIIFIGLPYIGSINYFEFSSFGLSGIFSAAALIFFAFIGFEEIVRLSEETKNPEKTIPKALIFAVAISTIVYMLVGLAAVSVLGWEKLGASNAPLAEVASVALGQNAFLLLSVIALFSTSNTALLIILATSRIVYGMAKDKSLPKLFSVIHPKTCTPWFAAGVVGIFSALLTLVGKIEFVGMLADFTIFSTFIIINLAVIVLRYKSPGMKRKFRIPLNIGKFPVLPLLGFLFSAFMLLHTGLEIIIYGIALIVVGIVLYEVRTKTEMRAKIAEIIKA